MFFVLKALIKAVNVCACGGDIAEKDVDEKHVEKDVIEKDDAKEVVVGVDASSTTAPLTVENLMKHTESCKNSSNDGTYIVRSR